LEAEQSIKDKQETIDKFGLTIESLELQLNEEIGETQGMITDTSKDLNKAMEKLRGMMGKMDHNSNTKLGTM
jgi:hypothetical protein